MEKQRSLMKNILKDVNVFLALFCIFFIFPAKGLSYELWVGFGKDKPPFVIGVTLRFN